MKRPLILLLFVLTTAGSLHSQTSVNLKRVVNNWPTIDVYYSIYCAGRQVWFPDTSFLRLSEDGIEIKDFQLLYVPQPVDSASTMLLLDASSAMQGTGNTAAKQVGNSYVDFMDSSSGNAAVMFFNQTPLLQQGFTSSKFLLHSAVNALPSNGASAVWDGVYAGLQEMSAHGNHLCKALIVATNGLDNASTHTLADCISYALQLRIRIFAFGVGPNIQGSKLDSLSDLTAGRYIANPSQAELQSEFQTFCSYFYDPPETYLRYQATCMDGTLRTVTVTTKPRCDTVTVSKSKSYMARHDTSTYSGIGIGLPTVSMRGNAEVRVPLQLRDAVSPGDILQPAVFTVLFDTTKAQFKSIGTPAGSILEGIFISTTRVAGGVEFRSLARKVFDSATPPGMLAELVFQAADLDGTDTVVCPLTLSSWSFSSGCFKPVLGDGSLRIVPRRPEMHCTVESPDSMRWNLSSHSYEPEPLHIEATLQNDGDKAARNAWCRIVYDKSEVTLTGSQRDTVYASPANIEPSGNQVVFTWNLIASPSAVGRSVGLCIEAHFDNAPDLSCCRNVWEPPSGPILSCEATAPLIAADPVLLRYAPMPFDVAVTGHNVGGTKTDTVFATIIVLKDLELAGLDQGRATKRVSPAILGPGQPGSASWSLRHPVSQAQKEYIVGIWLKTSNADSAYCEARVVIPALDGPVLVPLCSAPDSLRFDPASDSYAPNPFVVRLSCANRGDLPATKVSGMLMLPDGVQLVDPSEPLRKAFPSPMNRWMPGDSVASFAWTLQYTKRLRQPTDIELKFNVGGVGPTGFPTDTIIASCLVHVAGLPPEAACELLLPDSIVQNAAKSELQPNPFPVTYRVRNIGKQVVTLSTITIEWNAAAELTIDPSTPQTMLTPIHLLPGDTATVTWLMRVIGRALPRTAQLCATAYDSLGMLGSCCDSIPISGLARLMECDAISSEPVIRFDTATGQYATRNWVVTATLTNIGATTISNSSAELFLADSTIAALLEFDPAFPDNSNPKRTPVLFPKGKKIYSWGFRLKADNRTGAAAHPEFRIRYTAAELPAQSACSVPMLIESVEASRLVASCALPDTLRFSADSARYTPNPFDFSVSGVNRGFISARNVSATISLPPGVQFASPAEVPTKAFSPSIFNHYSGGAAPELTWRLRFQPLLLADSCIDVGFAIDGIDSATNAAVHAVSSCSFCVKAVQPEFNCALYSPDSLALNAPGNNVLPNPFTARFRIANIGPVPGTIVLADLSLPAGSDLSFDVSTPSPLAGNWRLLPGDTLSVNWLLHVKNLLTTRQLRLNATAYDSSGTPMMCQRELFIPAVITLGVDSPPAAPSGYALHQNSPNPFDNSTSIDFDVPEATHVRLDVYSVHGVHLATLVNERHEAGRYQAVFNAGALPNGVYFCRMESGGFVKSVLMLLAR